MTTLEAVVQRLQALSPADLEKVANFLDNLGPAPAPGERARLRGCLSHLNAGPSLEDCLEARRQVSAHLPRNSSSPEAAP